MADADIAITAGSGTKVDTRTVGAGTDEHRQVMVIGDPTTAANVVGVTASGFAKVIAVQEIAISTTNSSTTNLAAAAAFTGTSWSNLAIGAVQVNLFADQNCTVQVQQAQEDPGTNWNIIDSWTYTASSTGQDAVRVIQAAGSAFRVIVTNNGASTTTAFRLQTVTFPFGDPMPRGLTQLGNLKVAVQERGTLSTYSYIVPSTAVGASKLYLDLFNATGSGKVIRVLSVRPIIDTDIAVVGAVGIRLLLFRTSAVGTGGTVHAYKSATLDVAGGTITPQDTNNAALPAQITARHLPTAGATSAEWLRGMYAMGEEASTSMAYMMQGQFNMLDLDSDDAQMLTLRENQGIAIRQGAVASVGNVRFRITFTVE